MNTKIVDYFRLPIAITIIITICMAYMVTYECFTKTYNAISVTEEGNIAILHDDEEIDAFRAKGRPIINYKHDACLFVVVCKENYEFVSTVLLNDVEYLYQAIDANHEWDDIFFEQDMGEVDLKTDGLNIHLHFEWVTFEDGTKYLIVYGVDNLAMHLFEGLTIIQFVGAILCDILIAILFYQRSRNLTNSYMLINAVIHSRMNSDY